MMMPMSTGESVRLKAAEAWFIGVALGSHDGENAL